MEKSKHPARSGPFCWVPRFVRLWFTPRRSLESLRRQIERDGWPAEMVHNLKCPRCGADEIDDDTNNYPGGLAYFRGSSYGEGGTGWYAVKCECGHHYAQNSDW
jgi:hypothetical protein